MGCGCRSNYYVSGGGSVNTTPADPVVDEPLVCPAGQRVATRAGGGARAGGSCEPDIDLKECSEYEILVNGICTSIKECVPPQVKQADGSCQNPQTECVPPQVKQADGSCQNPQTFSNDAFICRDDEEKLIDRCVKRILCALDEVPDYASGNPTCKKRLRCTGTTFVAGGSTETWVGYREPNEDTGVCTKIPDGGSDCPSGMKRDSAGSCVTDDCPSGMKRNAVGDCVECTYSGQAFLPDVGSFSVEEFLTDIGIDRSKVPTIDGTVCDFQKDQIIDLVLASINVLDGDASVLSVFEEYGFPLPGELQMLAATFETTLDFVGTQESLANVASAAIQFGRGNFDLALLEALDAIPLFGDQIRFVLDNTEEALSFLKKIPLGGVFSGFVSFVDAGVDKVLDALKNLSPETKDSVIQWVCKQIGRGQWVPGPHNIPVALIHAGILFGKKEWDESVGALFSVLKWMKFGGKGAKIIEKILRRVLDVLAKLNKAVTTLGQT